MTDIAPEIVVEGGIPIPPKGDARRGNPLGRRPMYPWAEMSVGDSFLVPHYCPKRMVAINAAAHHQRRLYDYKFISRKWNGGIRVWRVE